MIDSGMCSGRGSVVVVASGGGTGSSYTKNSN